MHRTTQSSDFESLGVDVFSGEASFVSPHEIVVGGQKLRAKNFVIAAGTRPGIPRIEGLFHHRFKWNPSPLHAVEIPGYHRDHTDQPETR